MEAERCMRKLSETEGKELLAAYGIPVAVGREVRTAEEAAVAAQAVGYPVVLKVSHEELAHKSDVRGVVLGVANAEDAVCSAGQLLAIREGARVRVEKQAADGLADLICGFKRDPVFGPVVLVGFGGVFAEVLKDTVLHVGVPAVEEAAAMVRKLKGAALLAGARGREVADVDAVAQALVSLARIAGEHPEITAFDVNPLRVYPQGCVALDALADLTPLTADPKATRSENRAQNAGDKARRSESGAPNAAGQAGSGGTQDDLRPFFARAGMQEGMQEDLRPFFAPASVAVVGASTSQVRAGNIIIRNMKTLGYAGRIFPVNPSAKPIEGFTTYATVDACPTTPELAVLAVPYHQVEKVMEDVSRAGTRHAIVVSGGFSDAGPAGRGREARLVRFCADHKIRVMGPNSIGTLDSLSGFTSSIGILPPIPRSGAAIFGQTGTLSTGFALEEATVHGRGFSKIACLGNKPDVDESAMLEYLAGDPDTRAIGCYIEAVADGARFRSALLKAKSAGKPVVVLKSGQTEVGAAAVASHTGALAGEDAVYDALLSQCGAHRVANLEELMATLRTFDMCPRPKGNRVGVVSLTGVGCVLAADACGACGLEIARLENGTLDLLKSLVPEWAPIGNPADIWSTIEQHGPAEAYRLVTEAIAGDPNVDILLIISVLLQEGAFQIGNVMRPIRERFPDKPMLAAYVGGRSDLLSQFRNSLHAIDVPVFDGPAAALTAAARLLPKGYSK